MKPPLTERRLRRMCRFPDNYYHIVFKFDSMRHYLIWENSYIGKKWPERYVEVERGEHEHEILIGPEIWFTL